MNIFPRVSRMTLVLSPFVGLLVVLIANAGTDGTPESESARLQDEVTAARNSLDALVLKSGVKRDDPRVKEKMAILAEKTKAFQKNFQNSLSPSPLPTFYPNTVLNPPNGEREEKQDKNDRSATLPMSVPPKVMLPSEPSAPETVLSGEGIAKEVNYPKKGKTTKKPDPATTEESKSEVQTNTDSAGLSEIQYPKKGKTK